jgi:acid phosphatase type 7
MRRVLYCLAAVVLLGVTALSTLGFTSTAASSQDAAGDPVIGAVGDMACDTSDPGFKAGLGTATSCAELRTSDAMMADTSIDQILALGDYQYDCGDLADYQASYDPTWGRLDYLMHPVAGNHEYQTGTDVFGAPCPTTNSTAQNYFNHFAAFNDSAHQATNGHYSFDLGSWHIIALNANCSNTGVGGCGATSPQTIWLKKDLASTTQPCILAYWHQPLFTGIGTGKVVKYQPWWKALSAVHADVVLNGHVHNYQRFPPLDPSGGLDPLNGITEYIVGTGGEKQVAVKSTATPQPSAWRKTFGYLRMTLLPTGWTAEFIGVDSLGNTSVLDTSAGTCHL